MRSWLGRWLQRLIRSRAPQAEPAVPQVDQRADGRQAIQIGRVESMTVLHGTHAAQPVAEPGAEMQHLQVTVLHMLEASGDRRGAIEQFMQREFGGAHITRLSRSQLWRVQRYCEKIESRRMGRRDGA